MLKKILLAGAIALAPGAALAQSGSRGASPVTNWGGLYIGANTGLVLHSYSFTDSQENIIYGGTNTANAFGGLLGLTAGYNAQFGSFVLGLELDGAFAMSGTAKMAYDERYYTTSDLKDVMTARVRAGYSVGNTLFFATGGLAAGRFDNVAFYRNGPCTDDDTICKKMTHYGIAVGAGVEHRLGANISVKGEYIFAALQTKTVNTGAGDPYGFGAGLHMVRIGLNYSFRN